MDFYFQENRGIVEPIMLRRAATTEGLFGTGRAARGESFQLSGAGGKTA